MAESGLTLKLSALRNFVSEHQYGNPDYTGLTSTEQDRVTRVVASGLRQFYHPPRISTNGKTPVSHDWSFVWIPETITHVAPHSTGTVTIVDGVCTFTSATLPAGAADYRLTVNGVGYEVSTRDGDDQLTLVDTTVDADAGTSYTLSKDDYDLPDDFGHFASNSITYAPSATVKRRVKLVGEGYIRELRSKPYLGTAAEPYLIALRAKENVEATGTRSEVLFWPNVQSEALVSYTYHVRVPLPTDADDYVPGASDHSETILASCLAAGERLLDGNAGGPQWQHFQRMLEASVDFDRQNNRPAHLGYNADREPDSGCWPRRPDVGYVTYEGEP
jgi:hypothetical protein